MQLYKMELYKICKNKAFVRACIVAMGIWLLFFWYVKVGDEMAAVNGEYFQGYAAVQKNREITEEFKGVVTDEKLQQIIQKYGFPKVVKEDYPGFRDANYLTSFVVEYFTDGYMNDWYDYKVATQIYPIEETEAGRQGKEILLYYTKGWEVLLETFQMGMILGSITIIIGISVVFSQECQYGMHSLLLTTKRGKKEDITAKFLASFTVTAVIYAVVGILSVLLCYFVFGLDGMQSPYWLVMNMKMLDTHIGTIFGIELAISLFALFYLCTATLCISANSKSTFHSVVVSAVCWCAPVMIQLLFRGLFVLFARSTPIFLIMYGNIVEKIYFTTLGNRIAKMSMYSSAIVIILSLIGFIFCLINGYRRAGRNFE